MSASNRPRIYDCFTFFNELDVLEIRLTELDPLVDYFVIVEATHTFTGKPKPLYFSDNRQRYERFSHKIIHVVVDDLPLESPGHWHKEWHQRDAIMRGLGAARPDDRVIVSDCDEIPKPDALRQALALRGMSKRIIMFWCENYFYKLNLRNDAHDHRLGPCLLTMRNLKSPQRLREIPFRFSKRRYLRKLAAPIACYRLSRRLRTFLWPKIFWSGAWHFTCIGDATAVNLKFSSFSHADEVGEFTEKEYQDHLSTLKKRPFVDLPQAIQQAKFARLIA